MKRETAATLGGQTWIKLPVMAGYVAQLEDESTIDRRARVLNWLTMANETNEMDPPASPSM